MDNDEEVEEFLEHFGVKGMKWGQRKDRSNHGLNARARKAQALADRRPTRGNIRKAQLEKKRAERSAAKKSVFALTKTEKVVYTAAAGAIIAGAILKRKGNLPVSAIPMPKNNIDVSMKAWDASGKLIRQVGSNLSPENVRALYGG